MEIDIEHIPKSLISRIDYVIAYVDGASDDWFRIKMEIINRFPSKDRSRFSRRHESSRKHILNSFDRAVIKYWELKTSRTLWINPDKLHPANWTYRPHGWKLSEINEERRKQREKSAKKTD
jgi:hypothetical protein